MKEALKIANEVIEEQTEEKNGFIVDNDNKAEWTILKIREEKAESERIIKLCESQISFYQDRANQEKESLQNRTGNLKSLLFDYFLKVPNKKMSKTQETYILPSGKLKLKYPNPKYVRDEDKLVKWLEDTGQQDLIKIKKTGDWAELKKVTTTVGENVITEDGEVVEGVRAEAQQPVFDVELT